MTEDPPIRQRPARLPAVYPGAEGHRRIHKRCLPGGHERRDCGVFDGMMGHGDVAS